MNGPIYVLPLESMRRMAICLGRKNSIYSTLSHNGIAMEFLGWGGLLYFRIKVVVRTGVFMKSCHTTIHTNGWMGGVEDTFFAFSGVVRPWFFACLLVPAWSFWGLGWGYGGNAFLFACLQGFEMEGTFIVLRGYGESEESYRCLCVGK